ncbi:uncharacterized protein A4U43_C03F7460 [Asparagus officinalis]|uniref:SCP domain-containing protein n=1 Tax=Asparagus officinalis TaxID=4686 RepID=A0A5P1F8V5_ASPOF|nr:pathogenesis-related protein PRB1-3-like [Asparagus officinalis]ONK74544.1 uncharacterized protein A4U43_C03F7460 [Asparagus officinalis]
MKSSNLSPVIFILTLATVQLANAQNSPQDFVEAHNSARAEVNVGPVSWDTTVAAYAENYASQRIGDCQLVHSGGQYGENIFWGSTTGYSGVDAVNSWVSEKTYYDYDSNTCEGHECRHYTQVVWAKSVKIGCARVTCNNGGVFVTCNYDPPGNYAGQRPY